MLIYDLIEYSVNYSKISGSLWQYYRDKPNENSTDSESFESKIKKYLSNFWRTLKMPLINFETNIILTLSSTCPINDSRGAEKLVISETKLMFQL